MKRCSFFLLLILLAGFACADGFRIISPGDPLLDDLLQLVRVAGQSPTSFTPPLSSDEVRNALDSIDREKLSPAYAALWDRIASELSGTVHTDPLYREGVFAFSCDPELGLSARARTDDDVGYTGSDRDMPSLVKLPLELSFAGRLYAAADLELRLDPSFYDESGSNLGSNLPWPTSRLDLNTPLRAFVASGGPWWTLQIGRDRVNFGVGRTGNLAVSDNPDYYDFARVSLFSKNFKYTLFVTQLPLDTKDLSGNYQNNTSTDWATDQATALTSTTQRFMYYHRYDARFWDRLSVGLGEAVMVGNSPLELRFLNPLTMFHSFFSWRDYDKITTPNVSTGVYKESDTVGSMMNLDLEFAIASGITAYGQAVMNQFATEYEQEHWPNDTSPNGLGYLLGLEWSPPDSKYRARYNLEGVYTDPYLYNLGSPFASYIWMRKLSDLTTKDYRYAFIGHSVGRDAILVDMSGHWEGDVWALISGTNLRLRGSHSRYLWDWEASKAALDAVTPSGTVERRLSAYSQIDWKVASTLTLTLYLAFTRLDNADNEENRVEQGLETALGAVLKL